MSGRRGGMIWKVRQNAWKPPIRPATPDEVRLAAKLRKRIWRMGDDTSP